MTDVTIKEVLAARTAPGTWEHGYTGIEGSMVLAGSDDRDRAALIADLYGGRTDPDARAIVVMDHIIDPALAVVEAARARFDAAEPFLYDYPMSQDERQHMWERLRETTIAYREALAALDIAKEAGR